jgi:2-polyprenyl-6-methoxyphenol hydroxylase-like FAD-dependent oxidoreductase
MPQRIQTDVVIAGAGPTGLLLAVCLARLGVDAVIVDHKREPTRESRALVLQARSVEIYDQLGMVDRVLAEATVAASIRPGFADRAFSRIVFRTLGRGVTPYPHLYVLEQSKNERLLVERLRELGREVMWGHGVDSVDKRADGSVSVECTAPDGDRVTIDARYCVGADGGSSRIRTLAGIAFEGTTNDNTFYVIDATGVRGLDPECVNVRFGAEHFLLAFPMGSADHARLLGIVRASDGADVSESTARATLRRGFGVAYDSSLWFSTYRVHHRVARHFRAGPVVLAGDAAHIHSPVGAQGMNTGLQDAHNLACKLAEVLSGAADDGYLDHYEAERRPVARRLVSTTDTLFGVITSDRPIARAVRRWLLPVVVPTAAFVVPRLTGASRIFEYLSQTRVHYWMSDAARRTARGRRGRVVGRRLPWNGDNFDVLRSMQWHVHAYGRVASAATRGLHDALGVPVVAFPDIRNRRLVDGRLYLVRPDGFVAAVSTPDAAAARFARALAVRTRSAAATRR